MELVARAEQYRTQHCRFGFHLLTWPGVLPPLLCQDCDLSAIRATSGSLVLTTDTEQAEIKAEVGCCCIKHPVHLLLGVGFLSGC
jgi:hypothetical protein